MTALERPREDEAMTRPRRKKKMSLDEMRRLRDWLAFIAFHQYPQELSGIELSYVQKSAIQTAWGVLADICGRGEARNEGAGRGKG